MDPSGRNIKLDQADFIDMGPPSRDSGFSVLLKELEKVLNIRFIGSHVNPKVAYADEVKMLDCLGITKRKKIFKSLVRLEC